MKQWTVQGANKGSFDSLKLDENAAVPEIKDNEVLVRFRAASLNYRDLIIPQGLYPFPMKDGVVPCSDGAGEVEKVGKSVTRFKQGDKVLTIFNQSHLAGQITPPDFGTGVGGVIDGSLRQYGAYDQHGLVHMPKNLNFEEGSSLVCAGLTAWNALYGLEGRQIKPGHVVVTQGTGGVSIFAVQFAKAAGCTVVSTTSSNEKAEELKKLGADHVINYKENPNWGEKAKELTGGAHHVIEVGGPNTVAQSLKAVRPEGVISIIGFLGGGKGEKTPTLLDCLMNVCTARGILVGSRQQFEDMIAAVEANNIKPVVDKQTFKLEQAVEAFQYMWDQKHFGKLCITID